MSTLNAPMLKPAYSPDSFAAGDQADRSALDETEIAREERPGVGALAVDSRSAERSSAKLEIAGILEKEVACLRKEEREPRRVHLPFVERRVGEIRVERQRAGQCRRDPVEDVSAGGAAETRAIVGLAPVVLGAQRDIGLDVEAETGRDGGDAGERSGFRHVGELEARDWWTTSARSPLCAGCSA